MSFRKVGRSSVTSAGDSVDELPDEATVDTTQSSADRWTVRDKATVSTSHRSNFCVVKRSLVSPPINSVSSATSHVTTRLHASRDEPLSFQQVQHVSPDGSHASVDSTTFDSTTSVAQL